MAIKVSIDYRDGQYSLQEWSVYDSHYIEIPESLWQAYQAFCQQSAAWHNIIRQLDDNRILDDKF